ncbi:MAG: hypothetical protein ACREC8_05440 [Limisphaerales bacterium]
MKKDIHTRKVKFIFANYIIAVILLCQTLVQAQNVYIVDQFDPSGVDGNSYSGGQISNMWWNWFGSAFSNLVWDATSDSDNNPASGSMKITANFMTNSNFDGNIIIIPLHFL